MNIEDLQLIVETIYQHNPSAYKRGGDVELLNSHIKAMQHLKEVNKIHYKEYNLTDLEALSVIVKTCSDICFTIGQKNCQMFVAKLHNFLHPHSRMRFYHAHSVLSFPDFAVDTFLLQRFLR